MVGGLRAAAREQVLVAMMEIPGLVRHRVWRDTDPDQGAGAGVLLVPGFGVGDRSLTLTRNWLRARGYRPVGADIAINIGCTSVLVDRIETRLEQHAELTGGPVILLGQSRGGWLARLVAVRRPDLVAGLIMAGSPVLDPLGAHPHVLRIASMLAKLSAMGVPGLLDEDCITGDCFTTNMTALGTDLPPGLPAVAIYSRTDAIVPWQLCLAPCAEWAEIPSSHTGMGFTPAYFTVLAATLASWSGTRPVPRPVTPPVMSLVDSQG